MRKLLLLTIFAVWGIWCQAQNKQFEGHPHPNGVVITLGDTTKYHIMAIQDEPHLYDAIVVDNYRDILTISSPDKAGAVTIKFARSRIHFINDSTFTIGGKSQSIKSDTMKVYFKEVYVNGGNAYEDFTPGYCVNLRYGPGQKEIIVSGKFLYLDLKPVTNKVIYVIKR